jgi:hypothetical protein
LIKIKVNRISTARKLFEYLFKRYGEDEYLGNSMHGGRETILCKVKDTMLVCLIACPFIAEKVILHGSISVKYEISQTVFVG